VEAKELEGEIAKAVDILPPRQKSAFILRYYEGLDLNSIAEILGCRVGTVKAHLSYGRNMLRKMLLPYLKD
jgi:RNA polymerase sigma-70 factor (ECF subfamily)